MIQKRLKNFELDDGTKTTRDKSFYYYHIKQIKNQVYLYSKREGNCFILMAENYLNLFLSTISNAILYANALIVSEGLIYQWVEEDNLYFSQQYQMLFYMLMHLLLVRD
jgi:hypothetical protein